MNIKFLWVGKTKSAPVKALLADYQDRIRHWIACEIIETRDLSRTKSLRANQRIAGEGEELAKHISSHERLVALDESGVPFTSDDFSRWLESEQNRGARVLTFVVGGPEGLSRMISGRAHLILSLGKMTWPHEMCRVLLLEQVYRALCILHRIPYHKGR